MPAYIALPFRVCVCEHIYERIVVLTGAVELDSSVHPSYGERGGNHPH